MADWLEDSLMIHPEGGPSNRRPRSLGQEACRVWGTFHFSTRLNLEGADHFCRLALGAASMPDDLGLRLLAHRQTKWYLAAFFFELMSAYETLLQEMNVLYDINIDMGKVSWSTIKDKLPTPLRDSMEKTREGVWFKKLSYYRNTASHHAYIPSGQTTGGWGERPWQYNQHEVQLMYPDIDAAKAGSENITDLRQYLKKMLDYIHAVWEKMAEEFDFPEK